MEPVRRTEQGGKFRIGNGNSGPFGRISLQRRGLVSNEILVGASPKEEKRKKAVHDGWWEKQVRVKNMWTEKRKDVKWEKFV